jgi:arginine repressor
MVQHLAATGVTTTQRTVAEDYLALGLVAANSAGGRPRPLPFA